MMDSREIAAFQKIIETFDVVVDSIVVMKNDMENLRRRVLDLEINSKLTSDKVLTGVLKDLEDY